ncbi:MAG TPA: response regulator [Gammaproteobacteria bacterium]|nr:response regulator [Gammaproteobacteria bacterium]
MEPLISIVDDDRAVREALQRMLRSYGFVTAVFASAEQFLGSEDCDRTGCLILDVRMPGMGGIELHRHLTAEGCRIPTILITACPTNGERERAIAIGVASYLAKPFNENVLLETVRQALEFGRHAAE